MRLLAATVRNYRIHRELTVEFDPARTLIGGPNESGKSSLIEAVHRGLFLKSTVTGDARQSMVSTLHAGQPEVEIRFEADGAEYHLVKRFSGQTGTTTLSMAGGRTWHGEEAETRLRELLGVAEVGGGRGILERVSQQWSHIWVWQGSSIEDPTASAREQQDRLLRRLQEVGGAVVMQSEVDARVAARFAEAASAIFSTRGRARAGSELERAERALADAEAECARAHERLAKLEEAARTLIEAEATIARTEAELERLNHEWNQLEKRRGAISELLVVEKEQEGELNQARERLDTLGAAHERIEGVREEVAALRSRLAPRAADLEARERNLARLREELERAEEAYDAALRSTRLARLAKELAAARVTELQEEARRSDLTDRLQRAQDLGREIDRARTELAALAPVDEAVLQELRAVENQRAQAEAALAAMAAEIEVVTADRPVYVDGVALAAGGRRLLTEASDIRVGESVVRVRPGGGSALAEARQRVQALGAELQAVLDRCGLGSVQQAAEVLALRTGVLEALGRAEAALQGLDSKTLEADLSLAREAAAAARAAAERLRAQYLAAVGAPGGAQTVEPPATLTEARSWWREREEALCEAEEREGAARVARDTRKGEVGWLEQDTAGLRLEVAEAAGRVSHLEAELGVLVHTHGEDEVRAQALAAARRAAEEAESVLASTRAQLEELQPDLVEADRERLARARSQAELRKSGAATRRDMSRATLRSEGTDDPHAAYALASARLEAAGKHHAAVRRRVLAVKLVSDLFVEEQRALADRFSRPLAERINGYLQGLFGPQAHSVVCFDENELAGVELVRPGACGATKFDSLSGGTREQVAAAVRLAIAELLAGEHGGSLPVVFDDAFAYSDPERVVELQRMLDTAARRGLQVIVLTCNPSDYAALGAREVRLSSVS